MIKRTATSSFGVMPADPSIERDVLLTEVASLRAELTAYQQQASEVTDLRRQIAQLTRELATLRAMSAEPPPSRREHPSGLHPTISPQPRSVPPTDSLRSASPPMAPPRSAPLAMAPPAPAGMTPPPPTTSASDQGIDFGAISSLSPEQLDQLPYGLITLDGAGRVLHYNDTESRLVGLPRERVLGRNFFQEVAPCTRLREFEGRFRELVADPVRVRVKTFDFVFRFANGDQHVTVVMTPARIRGRFHVALLRREASS